ncbi:MAG: DUF418 domain-containing protein [Proteobacteria bacterium]|nr:DUF418 domain-containing protein [Pseudomonadota bacterium]MBU1739022.1 DUF418 domain-containing protein [Pseudomonadota bacterium]
MTQSIVVLGPVPVPPCAGIAAPLPEQRAIPATRIESYDIARAIAVLGMLVVNYFVIFLEFFEGDSFFMDLADLLCGRAAALFIMLAGVGLTLLGRKALDSGDKEALRLFRKQILMRCLVLYFVGHLLWLYWRADILHFYGLFLFVGALLITCSGRVLWLLKLLIITVAAAAYWWTGGDPDLSELFTIQGIVARNVVDLLFNGSYAAFPWLSFLLVGIWFGKNRMLSGNVSPGRIAFAAAGLFLVSEYLLRMGRMLDPEEADTLQSLLLSRTAFPLSPLYALSCGSSALLLLTVLMVGCRNETVCRILSPLKYIGRLSLTIYIGHVFLAYSVFDLLYDNLSGDDYLAAVIAFFLASCLFFAVFSAVWCKHFAYGPLEWVLRKAAKFQF